MRLREHPPHFLASNGTDPSPGDTDACWHRSSGALSSLQIIGRFHERRGVRCEHASYPCLRVVLMSPGHGRSGRRTHRPEPRWRSPQQHHPQPMLTA